MRKLGRKIYIHEEVSDALERDRREVAPRFAMLCRQLGVNEWVRFKPTKGENAGWRRSPLGGNHGSHYYMWWVAAGSGPGKQLPLGEGDIAIRAVRHHDLTDKLLPVGDLDEYWEFKFVEELDDEEVIEQPWTEDQRVFIDDRAACQILIGPPGSGKTSSLWRAVEVALLESRTLSSVRSGRARALYLTWSPRLAERADVYFQVMAPGEVQVYDLMSLYARLLSKDLTRRGLGESRARFHELIEGLTRNFKLKRRALERSSRLFDLTRAWIVGRAPWDLKRVGDSKEDDEQERLIQEELKDAVALEKLLALDAVKRAELFPELSAATEVLSYADQELSRLQGEDEAYDFVVIDEVQDLTPIELASAMRVALHWSSTQPQLFIAGDEGQVVRPTFFEFAELNDQLYQADYQPSTTTLGANLRSPKVIAECVNRVRSFHQRLSPKYRPADQRHRPSTYETDSLLGLYTFEDHAELSTLLEQLIQHPTVQLIDLFENPIQLTVTLGIEDSMTRHFGTAEAMKGLEFTSVCVVGAAHLINQLDGQRAQRDPLAFRLDLNRLRVALSRAMEHLVFIEPLSAVHDELRALIGGEVERGDWAELPSRPDLEPLELRAHEGVCLSATQVSELLAPSHLSSDERAQGFLGRAERLFFDEQRVVDALNDLRAIFELAQSGDLSEDIARAMYDLTARITLSEVLISSTRSAPQRVHLDDPLIHEALDRCAGERLRRLAQTLKLWSSRDYERDDLQALYRALNAPRVREVSWLSRVLSEHRRGLISALDELARHTEVALPELAQTLEILGVDQAELPDILHELRRVAFDALIERDWRGAEQMWSEVKSLEKSDFMRDAKLCEARGDWRDAALIYEAHAELGAAFRAYRHAGDLSKSGELLEGRDHEELERWGVEGLDLLVVSAHYLAQHPLSVQERATLLRHGSVEVSRAQDELNGERERMRERVELLLKSQRHLDGERLSVTQRAEELERLELSLEAREAACLRRERRAQRLITSRQSEALSRSADEREAESISESVNEAVNDHIKEPEEINTVIDVEATSTPEFTSTSDSTTSDSKQSSDELGETLDHIPALSLDRDSLLQQREVELFERARRLTQRELKLRREHHALSLDRERVEGEVKLLDHQRQELDQQTRQAQTTQAEAESELERLTQTQREQSETRRELTRRREELTALAEELAEREASLARRERSQRQAAREVEATRETLTAYESELQGRHERLERVAQEQTARAQELSDLSDELSTRALAEQTMFIEPIEAPLLTPEELHYAQGAVRSLEVAGEGEVSLEQTSAPRELAPPPDLLSDQIASADEESLEHHLDLINVSELDVYEVRPAEASLETSPAGYATIADHHESSSDDTLVDLKPISLDELIIPEGSSLSSDSARGQDDQRAPLAAGRVFAQEVEGVQLPLIYCPAGSFFMGSDQGEPGERPRHEVQLSEGFWMGQTPITQRQWTQVMGTCPSHFIHPDHPVERISWREAVIFCNRLSVTCGLSPVYRLIPDPIARVIVRAHFDADGFRLPTESEWEYAARAGQEHNFAGSNRARDVAWTNRSAGEQTRPVGHKLPNQWGLYDMSGNIAEWCGDVATSYEGRIGVSHDPYYDAPLGHRVIRGGSWACSAYLCRVSSRGSAPSDSRGPDIGVRVMRRG